MKDKQTSGSWRTAGECLLASLALAVLTLVSFRLHAGPAMAALLFFFLVVLISLWAGFLSTAFACALAALCYVYFFTQPLYHLWMSEPVEIAMTMAFSGTALIISRLISRVRERTAEVQRTNEQLQAEIAERQRAEEGVRQSEAELRRLVDAIPQHVVVVKTDGSFLYVNQVALQYTGLTLEDSLSKDSLAKIFHPDELERVVEERQQAISRGLPWDAEVRIRGKDGNYRWFMIRLNPLRDEQGRILRWYGTRTDIEDRKQAEEKVRQREAELQQLIDAIPQQVFVFDADWNPLFANRREREYTGLTPEEAQSQDALARIFHPDDLRKLEALRERMLSQNVPSEMEARIRGKDGQYRWFLIRDNPLRDEQGRVLRWYGTRTDIEDRKQAEEASHRLNRELRALSNSNQTLMRATDEPALLRKICRIVCEEAGYRTAWVGYAEHDEAQSVRPVAWTGTEEGDVANLGITWADTERGRGIIGTAIRSGKTCCIKDYATDPEVAPWRESALQHGFRSAIALPLKDEHTNIFGSFNIYSAQPNAFTPEEIRLLEELAGDMAFGIVTLRSKAAREQAEQEVALLSFAVDRVREAAFLIDDRGRFQYANEEAYRLLGYTGAELLGMGVTDIDPDFPAERWSDHWRDLRAQRSMSFESRHQARDGHTFPVEVSANYFEYGGRAYNLALVRDITERKKAEEERAENLRKLQESERHLRTLLENLPDCIARFDKEGRHLFVNSAVTKAFGAPTGQFIGKTLHESGAPGLAPQNLLLEGLIKQAFEEGFANSTECEWVTPQGIRYFDVRHVPEKDETGNVVTVVGISRDITERRRAEEKVRQQEMELRQVLDFAPQLIAVFGHDRERLYANRPTLDYFGVTLEEWQSISDRFWFYHPDDRERVARDVYTEPASDATHEFEARLRRKDGAYRWFLFRDSPLADEQGVILRWYFTATDIEDRKRAEEERRARVWFLESMDRVNQAIGGTNDLEQMTGEVINAMLSIFASDRAFLYYPCDPDAPSFEVFMERTRPEYPGARGVMPMTPETARGFQIMRASSGVVTFGPGCDYPLIGDFARRFGHQSSMGIALYPKTGQPWVLALQQCAYPRAWTAEEKKLLEEIARRLTDSLTSLLMFRGLRESEEALRRSEAYLAESQRLTLTGSWALDGTTRMSLYWSDETFRIWGFDPQQGLPMWEQIVQRIHPQDLHMYKEAAEGAILKKEDFDLEYRIVLPNATVKHLHTLAHSVLSPAGEVLELVGTSVDITERKRAEEALKRSQAYLAESQKLTQTGSWAWDPRTDQMVFYSEEVFRIYGLDPRHGAPTIETLLARVHPDDRARVRSRALEGAREGAEHVLEYRLLLPDGTIKYIRSLRQTVLNASGEVIEVLGTAMDVTERKRAEEALRAQAALLDLTHDTVFVMDMEGVIKYWNRGAEERYGWTAEHALGRVVHDLLKTVFPGPSEEIRAEVSRTGRWEGEILHTKKDGTQVVVASRWALQRDERGAPLAILETNNDLTLRKRAEEALRLSNAYNRSLIEASVDPLVTIGPDGKITDVNAATEAATGRSRGQLVGTDFCDYFTEPAKARAGYEQVFREGMVRDYPLELRHRDGGVMSVLYNASVYRDESGQVIGVFAAARDITKRQRAEEALRLSNAYNRSLIEASLDPLVTIGPDGKITDVNGATEAATGRSRGELVGADFCDYFTEPDQARAGYEQVFREGMVRDYPLELRHRDGGVMSVLYNASVYRDESGRVTGVFAAARDITERQRAEEALRESETRFRTFVDHAADALFIYDCEQGTIVDVNRQACESLGYTRQELIGTMGLAFDRKVDRAVTESIAERTAAGETVIDTHWHQRKDGTLFPVEAHTSQFWHGDRRFLLKIARDITDRLRAEEELRESEARFRTFVDHAADAFFVHDEDHKLLDVNRQACEDLGYTREELIGMYPPDFDPDINAAELQRIRERLAAGGVLTFETRHRRKDGTVFPVEVRLRSFWRGGGLLHLALVRNITERKRAEQERARLRQLEADLAHIDRLSMMGELAASIAHEVNQPLSGVVVNGNACLRWLAGDAPNLAEAREAVRRIVRDGKRAGDVIARVRALATKTATAKERLDLNEAIREVAAFAGDEMRKNRVAVRTEFAPDLLPVLGDRVQLQQVVLNLVMNGIEAMSRVEERPRELVVSTQNDEDQVRVTVRDSGIGLDPQSLERIFEAFYTTKHGGMGMGLSISRSIVQNHGGKLWAAANAGPGISVQFTIPKHP